MYMWIWNLRGNSIKHNSSVKKKVVISSQRKGEFFLFTVEDNGPGMAPKYHEKIFQMFQILDAVDKFENTGVWSSIVKNWWKMQIVLSGLNL